MQSFHVLCAKEMSVLKESNVVTVLTGFTVNVMALLSKNMQNSLKNQMMTTILVFIMYYSTQCRNLSFCIV